MITGRSMVSCASAGCAQPTTSAATQAQTETDERNIMIVAPRARGAPAPHPNSGLPEFGALKLAEVGYIRLRLGEGADRVRCSAINLIIIKLASSSRRYRNLADVLRHLVALADRRPIGDGRVPPLHVGIRIEVDRLPLVARDPRPDRDIGDRIAVRDELAAGEPAVEHAVEPVRFLQITLLRIGRL